MTYFVPELFSGIAFDSGAVVSGPMTATFILAFAHGVADAVEHASLLVDGFGIVAMVAMTPIIALQILGFIYNRKPNVEETIIIYFLLGCIPYNAPHCQDSFLAFLS